MGKTSERTAHQKRHMDGQEARAEDKGPQERRLPAGGMQDGSRSRTQLLFLITLNTFLAIAPYSALTTPPQRSVLPWMRRGGKFVT